MSILRIVTTEADFTTLAATPSTNATFYDPDRVANSFLFGDKITATVSHATSSQTDTWYHFVHGQSGTTNSHDTNWVEFIDPQANLVGRIRLDGNTMYFSVFGDTTVESTGTVIPVNTPVVIDFELSINSNIDIVASAYVNNTLQFSATVTNSNNKSNPNLLKFDNDDSNFSLYASEIIIADEDTRGFRLREFKPQSFGSFQQWDGTVSSVVDSSLATGVSTDVADARVSFGVDNLDNVNAGDIINRIVVQSHAQRGTTGLTSINNFFRYSDGSIEDGPDIALDEFGDWYVDEYVNNPDTGSPWTPAELAGLQLGIRARA